MIWGTPLHCWQLTKCDVLSRITSLCYFQNQRLAVSVCLVGLLLGLRGRNDHLHPWAQSFPKLKLELQLPIRPISTTAASGFGLSVSHRRLFSVNLTFVRYSFSHFVQSSRGEVPKSKSEDSVDSSYFPIDVLCLFDQGSPSPRPAHLPANLNGHRLTCQPYLGWTDPLNHKRFDCAK